MTSTACARNLNNCALKGMIATLARDADDDREKMSRDAWEEMLDASTMNGDEFADYDGPLTWA